jgi:hypothetical protein
LEFAAIQTLLNGGTVYVVEPEKGPDTKSLAAVFRYQFSRTFPPFRGSNITIHPLIEF